MELVRVARSNERLDEIWLQWDAQCERFGESFKDYATASMSVLRELAEEPETRSAAVFALVDESGAYLAICQVNVARIPGYDGPVLRLRHLVLAPEFDFSEEIPDDRYADVLAEVFTKVSLLSENTMAADHIKIHLRSRGDREFFKVFEEHLREEAAFATVRMQGAWLYITK